MEAAEYNHVVRCRIFLKYISDAFEEHHSVVVAEFGEGAAEDRSEYTAENIFCVPPEPRWAHLRAQARQATIGLTGDREMGANERDNPALQKVMPRDYARPVLDKRQFGQLIDLISNIRVRDGRARSRDVLGRVYQHLHSQFASAERQKGVEFYTPGCVVKLLAGMLESYRGGVCDSYHGLSGPPVQSIEFIRAAVGPDSRSAPPTADVWQDPPPEAEQVLEAMA